MLIGALEAGGTKMVCSIGNPQGGVLQRASFPTLTPDVTVPQIVDFIGKFDVKALGIGSYGPLDLNPASPTYGSITKTPKKEWIQYPLMTTLKDALGVPTGIDTDVNAAALAEYTMGAGKGRGSLLYVTVGTGIGGGIVIDGKVLRGAHCFAGEFSFLRNDVTTAAGMGNSFADSGGWRALRDAVVAEKGLPADSPVDGRRVFEWIADGDKAAQRALDRYARAFDGQLINLQAVLDPEVFVIAGGISCHPELVDALRAQMPLALASYQGTLAGIPVPQIKAAELGNDANLYGAVQEAMRLV